MEITWGLTDPKQWTYFDQPTAVTVTITEFDDGFQITYSNGEEDEDDERVLATFALADEQVKKALTAITDEMMGGVLERTAGDTVAGDG